jgi:hypothetical protein
MANKVLAFSLIGSSLLALMATPEYDTPWLSLLLMAAGVVVVFRQYGRE